MPRLDPPRSRSPAWAYLAAIAVVVLCTLVNESLSTRTHAEVLVMVYLLGLLPVAVLGNRGASLLAAGLSVAAFDFFFTRPLYTLTVDDPGYYFTFLVMGLVGFTLSSLTSRLAAERDTSRRRAQALAVANEELQSLDRLKSDLLSNVSHELRTPLATIMGNVELLQDQVGGPLSVDQQAIVAQAQQAATRLNQLVGYLLDFAQLDAGTFSFEMAETDLKALMLDVLEPMRPRAEAARLSLETRLPAEPVPVELDAGRIAQVLTNLLDNAIKFTPEGGRIVVELSADADWATFLVRDTGIGIPPEHLPRIFQKFYQVDPTSTRAFGGTGLGLAFSKALVEAHGGRIGVLSAIGSGSTFWVTLPRTQAVRAQGANSARSADKAPSRIGLITSKPWAR